MGRLLPAVRRCVLRTATEEDYKRIIGRPLGAFSLQSEIAKCHSKLQLYQQLPATDAYPSLEVVDILPTTQCVLDDSEAATMIVLPPSVCRDDEEGSTEETAAAPRPDSSQSASNVSVMLHPHLRGRHASASQQFMDLLPATEDAIVRVAGSHQSTCAFIVHQCDDLNSLGVVLQVSPDLFRDIRANLYMSPSNVVFHARAGAAFSATSWSIAMDAFESVETEDGELALASNARDTLSLTRVLLCPAVSDSILVNQYGTQYADLFALVLRASVDELHGRLVSTGDVIQLDISALTRASELLDGVDILEEAYKNVFHRIEQSSGFWIDDSDSLSRSLILLRVVELRNEKGTISCGFLTLKGETPVETSLVSQEQFRLVDRTPLLPPLPAAAFSKLEYYASVASALEQVLVPSLDCSIHTFVVHGVKENLPRELLAQVLRQFGVPTTFASVSGLTEEELTTLLTSFKAQSSSATPAALVLVGAEQLAASSPHLLTLLDHKSVETPHSSGPPAISACRLLFLLCETLEAVPPTVAARATNVEGVLRCGIPSEVERAVLLRELIQSASETHGLHVSRFLAYPAVAAWTVGLTSADLVALVDEVAVKMAAVGRSSGDGPTQGVLSDEAFEEVLQSYLKVHGYNMVSTKLQPVRWTDVGGLDEAKKELQQMIQLPLLHPELFQSGMKKRTGVLFYGPPGCGKTLLAKAVATEMNMNFVSVKGPELINQYVGESERNIRLLFQRARDNSPCIIFFDELDALAPARGAKGDAGGAMDRIVSQLLVEVDGVGQHRSDGSSSGDIFIIGATNRPDLLDAALLRPGRFDRLCYLGIPSTRAEQLFALKALTRKFSMSADVDLDALLEPLDFLYTGADFFALCSDAMMFAVEETLESFQCSASVVDGEQAAEAGLSESPSESTDIAVTMKHFVKAREQLKPSVTKADLHKYEALKQKFNK